MICWGHDGNYDELLTYPHSAYRALDVALSTTCGITTAGEAVCWGYNNERQADAPDGRYIGDPGIASDEALSSVDIAGAHSSSCALIDDGRVVCWGAYEQAEDGVGSPRPKHSGRPWEAKPADQRFKAISTGWSHSCGLTSEGVVHCWGFNDYGQLDVPTGRYQSVAASLYYSCGLRTDGQIRCWGSERLQHLRQHHAAGVRRAHRTGSSSFGQLHSGQRRLGARLRPELCSRNRLLGT